ncbi:MAG: NAD(P)/FAD-dependent oxidoreductase, partial [Gaiellales bacterium]
GDEMQALEAHDVATMVPNELGDRQVASFHVAGTVAPRRSGTVAGMSASGQPDVVVVGGGVIGVCAAYHLARQGTAVTVVEREAEVGRACSFGNAGLIAPSHCIPLARPGVLRRLPGWILAGDAPVHIRPRPSLDLLRFGLRFARSANQRAMVAGLRTMRDLGFASKALFEEILAAEGIDFAYRAGGLLNVCVTPEGLEELAADAGVLEREGIEPEILDGDAARAREPLLSERVVGGVFWKADAHCQPHMFVSALAAAAERHGARFQLGTEVSGLEHDGRRVRAVRTAAGVLRPGQVVLAAGSWTPLLARRLGLRVPIEPGRGYHLQFGRDAPAPRLPMIFHEETFAATPMPDGLRLAGTMEFSGMSGAPRPGRSERLLRTARAYLQGLDGRVPESRWSGIRPVTPDTLPIVGRSSRFEGLILATGHGMEGLLQGPVAGLTVAELVAGREPSAPVAPLTPARFGV